jgi:hypothetical protein
MWDGRPFDKLRAGSRLSGSATTPSDRCPCPKKSLDIRYYVTYSVCHTLYVA